MITDQDDEPPPVRHITDGVFFTRPRPLPRGPHGLNRDEVRATQRERFLIAFTELLAANGFAALRVSDISTRSGTSKTAFYDSFASLEECAEAAYERFVTVLLSEITAFLDAIERPHDVTASLLAYLTTLQRDVVVARAFQLELNNEGRVGRRHRRLTLEQFARLIREEHIAMACENPTMATDLPLDAYLGVVYAVRQLASDELDRYEDPDLVALAPRLNSWITASLSVTS